MMFEKFNVPALSICDQAVMSLKFAGLQHGLVVDCGGSGCNVIPVYNGISFTTQYLVDIFIFTTRDSNYSVFPLSES